MRLTPNLWGKPPLRTWEVPPQQRLPLKLADKVTTSKQGKERACLNELSALISCLNRHDYNNSLCTQELSSLQTCHKGAVARQGAKKVMQKKEELTHDMKEFTNKQLTNLLKKYPTK